METVVRFYTCYTCGKLRFMEDIDAGKDCTKCGGWHVREAQPTLMRIIRYFIHKPEMLKIFWKENICRSKK